jgi:endoglucanase
VEPDIGINLEAGVAGDYPGISQEESQERVGKGPAIFLHDASMLPNLKLRDLFTDVAKEKEIPIQFDVLSGYGEDGAEMQKSRGGVPTINIAIPTRYLHSHYGIISRQDFDHTLELITSVIQRLDATTVQQLKSFD